MKNQHHSLDFITYSDVLAAVSGPFLVGGMTQLTGNSAYGVFSLVILFIIGFIILLFVPDPRNEQTA